MSYNGFQNYETWSVALIINNDEWAEEHARELAQTAWDNSSGDNVQEKDADAAYTLAEDFREWVTSSPEDGGRTGSPPPINCGPN